MQTETYRHYLNKLGITLWVPNDFVTPEENRLEPVVDVKTAQNVDAPLHVIAMSVPLTVPAEATTTVNPFVEKQTTTSKLSTLPAVCMVKAAANARLTIVASPGNDPRASQRHGNDNLLDNMLMSIGISPEQYDLVQVAREQDQHQQALTGNVLWVCGQLAASLLFNRPVVLASMRGKVHQVGSHKIIVSYHPDELRKNPSLKKMAWQDLRLLAVALTQT